ncbi:UNVERIFIED_CONTAM: U5 small nuclear ribonucleoprotein [Trichonephila clavipes]
MLMLLKIEWGLELKAKQFIGWGKLNMKQAIKAITGSCVIPREKNKIKKKERVTRAYSVAKRKKGLPRTSNLLVPIMLLTGHQGEVLCGNFHPVGNFLASASFERDKCL